MQFLCTTLLCIFLLTLQRIRAQETTLPEKVDLTAEAPFFLKPFLSDDQKPLSTFERSLLDAGVPLPVNQQKAIPDSAAALPGQEPPRTTAAESDPSQAAKLSTSASSSQSSVSTSVKPFPLFTNPHELTTDYLDFVDSFQTDVEYGSDAYDFEYNYEDEYDDDAFDDLYDDDEYYGDDFNYDDLDVEDQQRLTEEAAAALKGEPANLDAPTSPPLGDNFSIVQAYVDYSYTPAPTIFEYVVPAVRLDASQLTPPPTSFEDETQQDDSSPFLGRRMLREEKKRNAVQQKTKENEEQVISSDTSNRLTDKKTFTPN